MNVSNNAIDAISGIYIDHPTISSISFSSFRNNNASRHTCIWCQLEEHQMTNINIIENSQKSTTSDAGIIRSNSATISMTHCSIFGNEPGSGFIFYGTSDSLKITCSDCSIGLNQINNSYFAFEDPPSVLFINTYEYLNLDECNPTKSQQTPKKALLLSVPLRTLKIFTIYET